MSHQNQTKILCPLRLDEPMVATTKVWNRNNTNTTSCLPQDGQMTNEIHSHCHRCASRDSSRGRGNRKMQAKTQSLYLVSQRIVDTTTYSCPAKQSSTRNKWHPAPMQLLLLVGSLLYLTQVALAQNTFLAPPTYPNPLDAPTSPSSCPLVPLCQCKWINGKKVAGCEKRNLDVIPANLPQDTQVLDMSGSKLIQLTAHVFQDKHLTNLQKIFLANCKISSIADQTFAQLTNLIELDLSHNFLQQVPVKSFEQLNHSLRRLSLANNAIQTIEADTFSALSHLNSLDLSNCQLNQLQPGAFRGLNELKDLKLHENRLTQLPLNVVEDLRDYLILDLYGNKWNCDCELRQSIDWMNRHHVQQSIQPTCETPQRHKDMRWISVKQDDFMCPPVILTKQQEQVVGVGSNVSLYCTARGSAPLTFNWFQDEKNLTTSTKLVEDRRYEIAEEFGQSGGTNVTTSILYLFNLQISDTNLFVCFVENNAGSVWANFSLIVNDSPPAPLAGSTGGLLSFLAINQTDAQVGMISLGFVFILVAAIVCLLMYKHSSRSSRSSQSSDLKHSKSMNGGHGISTISSSNKFAMANNASNGGKHRLSDTEDDDDDDEDEQTDERSSSGSASSCNKNPVKVMAAGELDGFIEHMRSGIINMDYHQMSPVIQFNNTLKKQQPSASRPPTYLDNNNGQVMHHLASPSNASSVPYYGAPNGSASMTTTTSDLSPASSNTTTQTNFANNGPTLTNCDLQLQQHQHHHNLGDMMTAPATNTTTTSYTSDYQSGYGAEEQFNAATMMPPMYYDHHDHTGNLAMHQTMMYNSQPGMIVQQVPLHHHHQQQQQQQQILIGGRMLPHQQQQQPGQQQLRQHRLSSELHML